MINARRARHAERSRKVVRMVRAHRRVPQAAVAALALAAATTLAGCSNSGQPNGNLNSQKPVAHIKPKPSPSPSPTGPVFNLPPDLHVNIDPDTTSNATQNAVLQDAGYAWMSYMEAISNGNPNDPNLLTFTRGTATSTFDNTVNTMHKANVRYTGTDHIFKQSVQIDTGGQSATYLACEDESLLEQLNLTSKAAAANNAGNQNYVAWRGLFINDGVDGWVLEVMLSNPGDAQCMPS